MPGSTYDTVRAALIHRRTVIAMYQGFRRELCPWAIGSKGGVPRALFYQRGGQTSTGPVTPGSPDNWRCMDLHELTILEVVDGEWVGPTAHRRASHCLDVIDVDHTPRRR
jgi:hypothetical protein